MYYVYIIQSINYPEIIYVGSSQDTSSRIIAHNNGESIYTKDYRPWQLLWRAEFKNKTQALDFEHYLKSHSGRAFMQKRLL